MNLVWRLARTRLKGHLGALLIRFLVAACVAATPYTFSFLGKWLVDEALQVTPPAKAAAAPQRQNARPVSIEWKAKTPQEKLRLLLVFFAASMGIHVFVTGLSFLSELLNARTVQQMTYELRSEVREKLAHLEMRLFTREQVGQRMTRVFDDCGSIAGNLVNLVINACTQTASLILGIVLLLRLDVTMTLVALTALPFYAVSCLLLLPRLRRNAATLRDRYAMLNGHVIERLSAVTTIKSYAQEDREIERFGTILDGNMAGWRQQNRLNVAFATLTTLITAGATLSVLAFGFLNIKAGRMRLGEVLAFYQVTARLFVPISALVGATALAQTLRILAERIYEVLDTEQTLVDAPDAVDLPQIRGDIAFEGVSLRYQEGGPFAVRDVTLAIPAGTVACFVGPTGCGKSTLLNLLTRLYDPTEGTIRIDGVDIRKLRVNTLRRSVGNILHDPTILTATVAENIRFGAPEATQEEIEAAARTVELHDDVAALPRGYDTLLGRGGAALSPEQMTRLAVARALVTRPAILTIDDTFSAIEEDVEKRLRAAVRTAHAGRTVLIATSRLSICQDADTVVVMHKGQVVQTGTHHELLGTPGVYRRMYMRQMGLEEVR